MQRRKRLRITWVNTTKMWHPMHVHGHTFQVNGTGPLKDTVNACPARASPATSTPITRTQRMTHRHNVYHEQTGLMGIIGGYIT